MVITPSAYSGIPQISSCPGTTNAMMPDYNTRQILLFYSTLLNNNLLLS